VAILLTQVGMDGPVPTTLFQNFWTFAGEG